MDLQIDQIMKIQDIAKKMGIPILPMWEDGVPEHHFYAHVARPPLPDRAYTAIDQDGKIVVISANENLDEDLGVAEAVLHELMHIRAASFGDEGNSGLMALQYSCILRLEKDQQEHCRMLFSDYSLKWSIPGSCDNPYNDLIGGCEIGGSESPEAEFVFQSPEWQEIVATARRSGLIDAHLEPIWPSPKTIRRRLLDNSHIKDAIAYSKAGPAA